MPLLENLEIIKVQPQKHQLYHHLVSRQMFTRSSSISPTTENDPPSTVVNEDRGSFLRLFSFRKSKSSFSVAPAPADGPTSPTPPSKKHGSDKESSPPSSPHRRGMVIGKNGTPTSSPKRSTRHKILTGVQQETTEIYYEAADKVSHLVEVAAKSGRTNYAFVKLENVETPEREYIGTPSTPLRKLVYIDPPYTHSRVERSIDTCHMQVSSVMGPSCTLLYLIKNTCENTYHRESIYFAKFCRMIYRDCGCFRREAWRDFKTMMSRDPDDSISSVLIVLIILAPTLMCL